MAAVKRDIFVSVTFRIIVCVAVLGVAGLIFKILAASRPQPAPSGTANAAPRVVVMRAAPVPVRRQWHGFGTARAMDAADVPARVTATVIERPEHIRPGRTVTRGEI